MNNKVIIVGDSAFAEVAYQYFTYDSQYEVVSFAVESKFRKKDKLLGLPVIDLEDIQAKYDPSKFGFFTAITHIQLNRVRTRVYDHLMNFGFTPVSYVSSTVKIWPTTQIGKHCFIFENNVIQPFAKIGDNCILWSGNHIGHHSSIGNNCFVSSHVVLSGFSKIGENCFLGVNCAISETTEIGSDCIVGAGSIITKNLADNMVTQPTPIKKLEGARTIMRVVE